MDNDGQQIPKAIPRFASFRSETLPPPTPKPHGSSSLEALLPSNSRPDSVGEYRRRGSEERILSGGLRGSKYTSLNPEQQYEARPKTFTLDASGETRILHGLNYGVPSYSRPICFALGLEPSLGPIANCTAAVKDYSRLSISKHFVPDLRRQRTKLVSAKPKASAQTDDGADFIPFQGPDSQTVRCDVRTGEHSSSWKLDGRTQNLTGDGVRSPPVQNRGNEEITDDSAHGEDEALISASDELLQQRAVLSRKVKQDPADWQSWLRLVQLQDEIDGLLNPSIEMRHTNAERQSNAEVILTMYEKALKHVKCPEGRELLYIGLMLKAPQIWARDKMGSKWQTVLEEHPSSHRLWKQYLDFQFSLLVFNFEDIRTACLNCLKTLQDVRARKNLRVGQHQEIFTVQMYILLRLTLLLREGGYTEIAVAMWQAMLEFEFIRPHSLQLSSQRKDGQCTYDELILAFERFWESEAPRIGEPNNNDDFEPGQLSKPLDSPLQYNNGTLKFWADAERVASQASITSKHTTELSDDPYRVVLFSDIRPALIGSPTASGTYIILSAFICFCHLPPYKGASDRGIGTWCDDQFIRNELLHDSLQLKRFLLHGPDTAASNDLQCSGDISGASSSPFAFPIFEYQISSDTLFSTPDRWFSAFGAKTWNNGTLPKEFIFATLRSLVTTGVGGDDLAEYLLALELQISPQTVTRSAKSLLRKRPSSLRLYNAYAQTQYQLGKGKMANAVIDTAISKIHEVVFLDKILLWRSRLWENLTIGRTSIALAHIIEFSFDLNSDRRAKDDSRAGETTSASALLRLRNALADGRDYMSSLNQQTYAVYYAEILVLVDYIQNGISLHAARKSFDENLRILSSNVSFTSDAEELLRQSLAKLLYTHVSHKRPFSPSIIRSFLTESIITFPRNTIFLSLYAWNESRFRIDDRVRGIMQDIVLHDSYHRYSNAENQTVSDKITTHLFAVYTDLQRGVARGSNRDAVRGSFERALRSVGAAQNASLWKLYFLFEYENGDTKRASDVFYRAVTACYWVKELYMLAFEYLADDMPETQLRELYETMVEKGLRIHVAL
ncbi:MAG: hypothetical protein Q9219_006972 [cf. Caloplaca sp. 3 TL-2023]